MNRVVKVLKFALIYFICIVIIGLFIRFTVKYEKNHEYSLKFQKQNPPYINNNTGWVDSLVNTMTLDEKIGQLFMVNISSNYSNASKAEVEQLIKDYHVGGIIIFQADALSNAKLINSLQSKAKIPLMVAIDGEWGLNMRLENTIQYPKQMMLGAITNESLIYDMGAQMAEQFKRMGIHINFAPVVDVNNNPENPVINIRSFGEDRVNVSRKGILYMKGLQDNRILAVAKHFPGHGDTDTDSHYDLPIINHTIKRLDSIELFPFKHLINAGVGGMMIAHTNIPAYEPKKELASTLSANIVDSLLLRKLKYEGIVFTDAMNMGAISERYKPHNANILALRAGNDILLMPASISKTITLLKREIRRGNITHEDIDNKCRKILQFKCWAGLSDYNPVKIENLNKDLNIPKYQSLNRKLIENALTLIKNDNNIIPLKQIDTLKIMAISIGGEPENKFFQTLDNYCICRNVCIDNDATKEQFNVLMHDAKKYHLIIIGLHSKNISSRVNYGISDNSLKFIDSISIQNNTILTAFINPYILKKLNNLTNHKAILVAYENNENTQNLAAQSLFGSIAIKGKLPVTINDDYKAGNGLNTSEQNVLRYSLPFDVNMNTDSLQKIDSIIYDAIQQKATPGCVVLVARDGHVVFQKAYGYYTYQKKQKAKTTSLYDLASLTKVSATVPLIMRFSDENKININDKLSDYLTELDTTNKSDLHIKDILAHQARLKPWIPFYVSTIEPLIPDQNFAANRYSTTYPLKLGNGYYVNKHLKYIDNYYSKDSSATYPYKVVDDLYLNKDWNDSIYNIIAQSELYEKNGYRYSDLGFILLHKLIENQTKTKYPKLLDSLFYHDLGISRLTYNPLYKFNKSEIAPTENDLIFRKKLVHGYVHDPGAAMLGGVSGHAGLFGTANDLAKLFQMYLNRGTYGGKRYIKSKTLELFTSCYDCKNGNRRGLGFDKPQPDTTKASPVCEAASLNSYGHTGFTGTMVWIDPDYDLLYIFLSNRLYPDAINNKLSEMDVRTNIQDIIYNSIIN